MANFFDNGNYWLTLWLTENTILYIQPKKEQKCQAHNLKVVGSNPTPATNLFNKINNLHAPQRLRFLGFFCCNFKCLCQPLCQPVVRFFLFFTYSDTKYYILFNFHRTFSKLHNYCSFILIYNTIKSVIIDI